MIFRKSNKDEFEKELIETLNGINDTLNSNGFEDKLNDTECRLMEEIGAVNSNFDNLKKGVNEYTKTIGNLCNRIDEQDKIIKHLTRETDENYNLIIKQEKRINQLVSIVEKYGEIVKEHILDEEEVTTPDKIKTNKKDTIRKYPESLRNRKPHLLMLRKDGTFKLKNGMISKWNINHILYLKKLIPQTQLNMEDIAEKVKLTYYMTVRLCCAIEDGDFDKYFDEWEQINANNTYGNWKPSIENNPQKRKEKGYC